MDIEYGVRGEFSPIHKACPKAKWPHSHHYLVGVSSTGDLDPVSGSIRGTDTLRDSLLELLSSLGQHELETTLPGSSTSLVGVAAALTNELAPHYPRITEVTVTDMETAEFGRVRRTPRVL